VLHQFSVTIDSLSLIKARMSDIQNRAHIAQDLVMECSKFSKYLTSFVIVSENYSSTNTGSFPLPLIDVIEVAISSERNCSYQMLVVELNLFSFHFGGSR